MPFPATISATAIEFVLGRLLPLLLTPLGGDEQAARALLIELLICQNPQTAHELLHAGQAVGFNLQGFGRLMDSAGPDSTQDVQDKALKLASSLARTAEAEERRLAQLQQLRRTRELREQVMADAQAAIVLQEQATLPGFPKRPAPEVPKLAAIHTATEELSAPQVPEQAATQSPAVEPPAPLDVPQAEAKLKSAEKLLGLMKAHWKGASPPPYSKAAQDIKDQARVVAMARMALAQARNRAQQAASQAEAEARAV